MWKSFENIDLQTSEKVSWEKKETCAKHKIDRSQNGRSKDLISYTLPAHRVSTRRSSKKYYFFCTPYNVSSRFSILSKLCHLHLNTFYENRKSNLIFPIFVIYFRNIFFLQFKIAKNPFRASFLFTLWATWAAGRKNGWASWLVERAARCRFQTKCRHT